MLRYVKKVCGRQKFVVRYAVLILHQNRVVVDWQLFDCFDVYFMDGLDLSLSHKLYVGPFQPKNL